MKKQIIFLVMLLANSLIIQAQAPQAIPYQAVARNVSGALITNQNVSLRFSIHDITATGTVVYSETQNAITNAYGLFSLNIGQGTPVTGSFASINWGSAAKFTQVEIDLAGGSNFVDMGTQQMMSVPYAQYAGNGLQPGNAPGNMQYWNGTAWVFVAAGSQGQVLTFCNGVPTWGGCPPSVSTSPVNGISSFTATSGGNITNDGASSVTARGVCWSTSPAPTTALSTKTTDGAGSGPFSSSITGLSANTFYYVRAYATNNAGTAYGNETGFTTSNGVPSFGTTTASNIGAVNAFINGNVISDGGAAISARGICWSTTPNATIANSHLAIAAGAGTIVFNVNSLQASTTYYLSVYATNATGTYYSNEVSFTTLDGIAILTTTAAGSVTAVSAVSGGNITYDGGAQVIQRGVCWSTSPNPTIALPTKTNNGVNAGTYSSNITGLSPSTTYYVRAYATNFAATTYGNEISFTTQNGSASLTTATASCVKGVTAVSGGDITSDGGGPITARGVCWSTSPNPTTALSTKTSDGSGSGTFSSNLSALTINTTYYIRAYAVNAAGTFYGNQTTILTTSHYVGESFGGGIVVYVDCTGQHGIVSATSNISTFFVSGTYWYNNTYVTTGATGTAIGTGQANTNAIISAQGSGIYAAALCNDLVLNGFSDWYLPSNDELLLLQSLGNIIGGFTNEFYWSSTQVSQAYAKALDYAFAHTTDYGKENIFRVRPVRSF